MLKRTLVSGISVVYLLTTPVLVLAPEVGWAQLEEIVVTTRRRTENLQEVPISVTAFTAEMINRQGIRDLSDVTRLDPSVSFDTSFNSADTRVNIRGLSATRGRSNVAFLIDGIDVTSENTISAGSGLLANRRLLNDVERIEVIKGSQSALYGRAAFSGAISYITKEPGDEFEGNMRLDAGKDGFFEASGAFGGPLPGLRDVLGVRLNGVYWTSDGYWQDQNTGADVGGGDGWGGALTSVFTPTETLKFKARVEYSDENYDVAPTVRAVQRTPVPYPESTFVRLNPPGRDDLDLSLAGGYSTATSGMPDNGLYCAEVLPPELKGFDERQLALKQLYPDYPTMSAHVPVAGSPHPDDNVIWKQALSDGSDPLVPGFCLPATYGDTSDKSEVQFSENPETGGQYDGTDIETLRATLLATWDFDHGSYSWNTGWTDSDGFLELDQDHQSRGFPDTFLQSQGGNSTKDVEQFSSEIRFASDWDGPFQMTLGGLYWHEERQTLDRNFIIDCFLNGKNLFGLVQDIPGLCDGTDGSGNTSGPGTTVDSWQAYWQQLQPHPGALWDTETDHLSAYVMFEFELSEAWKLTFEDRYVDEDFDLAKPVFSSCTNFAFGISGGLVARPGALLDEAENPGFDARCTSDRFTGDPILFDDLPADIQSLYTDPVDPTALGCEKASGVLLPGFPLAQDGEILVPFGSAGPGRNTIEASTPGATDTQTCPYGTISGSTDSSFHLPKVTLEWTPTDDALVYLSWAKARKPAGINQISSGGTATTIDEERFDAEVMDTYEIGTKTSWEIGGYLQLNGAIFFQDYTDKQVGTQILVPDGQGGFRSNPRVVNASAAEVWGVELEVLWQPAFAEGLVLSGAYTHLDTEYVEFSDESTNFVRAAMNGACPVVWKDSNDQTVATGTVNPNPDPDNPIFAPKCAIPLSGNNLERAPDNAFVGSINYTRQVGGTGFNWFLGLDVVYQDERWGDQDNFVKWEDYWLADARIGLEGEAWTFLVYVDNVFDDDTIISGGSGPDFGPAISDMGFSAGLVRSHFFGPLPIPRNFGVRLSYQF